MYRVYSITIISDNDKIRIYTTTAIVHFNAFENRIISYKKQKLYYNSKHESHKMATILTATFHIVAIKIGDTNLHMVLMQHFTSIVNYVTPVVWRRTVHQTLCPVKVRLCGCSAPIPWRAFGTSVTRSLGVVDCTLSAFPATCSSRHLTSHLSKTYISTRSLHSHGTLLMVLGLSRLRTWGLRQRESSWHLEYL